MHASAMSKREHLREVLTGPLDPAYQRRREAAGWRLAAVEWVRDSGESAEAAAKVEAPYGLHVSSDGIHLEEDATEKQMMMLILEMIVQDTRLPQIAVELNSRGLRTRGGGEWTPVDVFNLLPRLIEAGPAIFSSEEWVVRRPRLVTSCPP
jgi:Recombinase